MARRRVEFGFFRGVLWFAACLFVFSTAAAAFAGWKIIPRPAPSDVPHIALE